MLSSTRQLHQVPVQPMNPPKCCIRASTASQASPQAQHAHIQQLLVRQRVSASQHQEAQGVSDGTKAELCSSAQTERHSRGPRAAPRELPGTAGGVTLSPHSLPCIQEG